MRRRVRGTRPIHLHEEKNMIDWLLARLSEPSTYAGFAAIAGSIGLSAPLYSAISAVAVAVAGLVAVILHEKKPAA